MIRFKRLTIKNFLSVGNNTQEIDLNKSDTILVLGENLDSENPQGSRNGVGKTSMMHALSYALYGLPISQIKKDNLINKINKRHMLVTVEFEKNGNYYRIVRGRKPNILEFYVSDKIVNIDNENEAEGDSRNTQAEIEKVIGCSHNLAKHILFLNTYTLPFFSLPAHMQRQLIEELFGISELTQKAEILKEKIRETQNKIVEEETRIAALQESNTRIQKMIDELEAKSLRWEKEKSRRINELKKKLKNLENVDIDEEIKRHKNNERWAELQKLVREFKNRESEINRIKKELKKAKKYLHNLSVKLCPVCEQPLNEETHKNLSCDYENLIQTLKEQLEKLLEENNQLAKVISEYGDLKKERTVYKSYEEALMHRNTVENLKRELENENRKENPFVEQIEELKKEGLQEISYDKINELKKLYEHQKVLLKLLQSKDSFIRKKIISQNLDFINNRIKTYLSKLELPHSVRFTEDLSVDISEMGVDFDFDNLSRGEKMRLVLATSLAFRDMFEMTRGGFNIVMVDELIDNGFDQAGIEMALSIFKEISRERKKTVYVVSHRDELISRMTSTLIVRKQNGFTEYSYE